MQDQDSGLVVLAEKLRQQASAKHVLLTLNQEGLLIHAGSDDPWVTDLSTGILHEPSGCFGAGDCLDNDSTCHVQWFDNLASRICGCGEGSSKSFGQSADCPSGTPYGCGIAPMKAILLAGGNRFSFTPHHRHHSKMPSAYPWSAAFRHLAEQLTAHEMGPFLVIHITFRSRLSIMLSKVSTGRPLLWPLRVSTPWHRQGRCVGQP